jgi:hypothetical protein
MSGGTGRRRKPPVGEEANEQYTPPQPPAESYPQYQTYQQPAQESYDYDWRQQSAAPAHEAPAPAAPAYEQPAPAAYQPPQYEAPRQPVYEQPQQVPQQPQYDPYQAYQQQAPVAPPAAAPATDYFGSGSYEIPQQGLAAPARPRPMPRSEPLPEPPRPEPVQAAVPAPAPVSTPAPAAADEPFAFEFDPDDEPAAQGPVTGNRPADKDGYRAGDFAFVDQADDPDVNGWLSFSESRADSRAERIRSLRVRLVAVGVVLALAAAGVGVYVWLGGSVPGLTGQATDAKSMILFRLDDAKGDAVGDALLVTDRDGTVNGKADGSGAIVVIPSQMQIDSQGFGSTSFGGNMASQQPPAGADEVSSTFGVTPTGVRDMDETTFGIFVQELGGLSVTTNAAVPASTADPTGVPLGQTTLTGAQAVAYATYSTSGESATAQAERFGQVMDALIAKLPPYANEVGSYLNLLGLIPDPSLPLSKLNPILAALAAQQNAGKVTVATLPLTSGGALNATAAASAVSQLLGGTIKASASAG